MQIMTLGDMIAPSGIVASGTALGHAPFINDHVQKQCDRTCEQIDKLDGLPLDPQTQ